MREDGVGNDCHGTVAPTNDLSCYVEIMNPNLSFPTASAVSDAAEALQGYVRRTPLIPSPWLSAIADRPILLKLESLQETGSFKARGALNFLFSLRADERARGVVTASAGNHGQGLAWAGRLLGVSTTIVLPVDAVAVKVERTRARGATVVLHGHGYDEAHGHALTLAAQTGACYVPAYEHPTIMAGQGSLALEIVEDRPDIEGVVVPVGGGGLVSGVAAALSEMAPRPWVLGVQSDHTRAVYDALTTGGMDPVDDLPTLADGLAGETDPYAVAACQAFGLTVELVPETALLGAIGATLLYEHLAIEGSAAVAVAAVLQGGLLPSGHGPVALVLSGGNVAPSVLASALASIGSPV